MRHLCDEAVDEAPPSLLVRCIVPLIYWPRRRRRRRRDAWRRGYKREEGFFRIAETRRIEVDRNGPTESKARRAEESERESEMADVGE